MTALGEDPDTVLSGVTTAIGVDTVLCLDSAILVDIFVCPANRTAR